MLRLVFPTRFVGAVPELRRGGIWIGEADRLRGNLHRLARQQRHVAELSTDVGTDHLADRRGRVLIVVADTLDELSDVRVIVFSHARTGDYATHWSMNGFAPQCAPHVGNHT